MSTSLSLHNVEGILFTYGREIMDSEEFQSAFCQIHHMRTTVAEHSVNVAVISILLCLVLTKMHRAVDLRAVVQAALCHDLGILGRENKYHSNYQCCQQHPVDSVETARRILREYDDKTLQIIETHMWPARPGRPSSLEGYIVTLADKYAAIREVTAASYHSRHIAVNPGTSLAG